jgi:formamidopyrimidine-DNA glycosylase
MATHLVGRRVTDAWTDGLRLREPLSRAAVRSLVDEGFEDAVRRAKFLLFPLTSGRTLLVHLGMTGNLVFRAGDNADARAHDHVVLDLDEGPPLVYTDPRRFGLFRVLTPAGLKRNRWLRNLGVEPLSSDFDADFLLAACRGRTRPIKSLLLDGHLVVGVGNIYASEALFAARIRPTTAAGRISRPRMERLVTEIKTVLQRSIDRGGTTISDYLGSGKGGLFQQELSVYGRAGEGCIVCDKPITNKVLSGRSTFYCTTCQH